MKKSQINKYEHKVQYYETDKMGIVHHSNYIRWFEEARVDFLEQIDLSFDTIEEKGLLSPVIDVNCQYKKSAKFGDTVIVNIKLTSFGRIRFVFGYKIEDKKTGELLATGKTSHCFLDDKNKIISLERQDKEAFEKIVCHAENCISPGKEA